MPGYADLAASVAVEVRGAVRVVTLDAPQRLNAVDREMSRSLVQLWDLLADDDDAGAVVLTGAGSAFCAGGHYPDLLRFHEDPAERAACVRDAERLLLGMIRCDLPVVAAVNGPAIGLGASLAAFCDIVLMADDAYLMDPHVSVGVVAGDGGPVVWPLLMSLLRAKEHLLLGDRISASECERIGLANRVVAHDALLPEALDLAERLVLQPREALRGTKHAINLHLRAAADLVLSYALSAERESFASADVRATIDKFNASRER